MLPATLKSQNILLLSVGSKVAIVKIAQNAAQKSGATLHISDSTPNIPSRSFADTFVVFETPGTDTWIQAIIAYCAENQITLIVPTRHSELECLNRNRESFKSANIQLVLSSPSALDICLHKTNTAKFFSEHSIPCPQTQTFEQWQKKPFFPAIAKPQSGSGANSVIEITTGDAIPKKETEELIVQSKAPGIEYTINAYVDRRGHCICAIPHRRIFVENGEVMQARTERIDGLIEVAVKTIHSLNGVVGPINLQAFYDKSSNTCQFIEINPRIGGGFPLAHQAGGRFFHWLCREFLQGKEIPVKENWTENLTMMRYRDAVFH